MNLRFLVLLVAVLFMTCGNSIKKKDGDNKTSNENTLAVEILFVDQLIFTPYSISCDYFEGSFEQEIKKTIITHEETISNLISIIERLEECENDFLLDVRMKIRLYKNNDILRLCIGSLQVHFNGKNYNYNFELHNFLKKILDSDLTFFGI